MGVGEKEDVIIKSDSQITMCIFLDFIGLVHSSWFMVHSRLPDGIPF